VAESQPCTHIATFEQCCQVSGREGIAGADALDDAAGRSWDEHLLPRRESGGSGAGVLDDDVGAVSMQQVADLLDFADAPQRLGLIASDKDQIGAASELEQHLGGARRVWAPERGPVVDIEGDERTGHPPPCDDLEDQLRAAV